MRPTLKHIAGIECLAIEKERSNTAVLFLHGYGANMHDLFPLWKMWDHENFDWFFPNGIQSLPMGHYEGRAWYSIDMEKLERAIREGTTRDMAKNVPSEMDESLGQLEHLLIELSAKYKKIVIGGFSQGAMCASHLSMMKSFKVDGLVLLSGNLLAEEKFPNSAYAVPFYQSHGTGDPILSVEGAKLLEAKLHSLNFKGKLHLFNGGHEIPTSVIQEVKTFLTQI